MSQTGLAIMAAGLLIEGVADLQKSHFKEKTPDTFCSRYERIFPELSDNFVRRSGVG